MDLAQYGTSIYHLGVSACQNKITKCDWKMKWKLQTHSAYGNLSNLEKLPGIHTLFLKIAEDDNLTGLQTIIKKAFHMLISNRTTKRHVDAHSNWSCTHDFYHKNGSPSAKPTTASPTAVQFASIQLDLPQFSTLVHRTSQKFVLKNWFICTKLIYVAPFRWI